MKAGGAAYLACGDWSLSARDPRIPFERLSERPRCRPVPVPRDDVCWVRET